MQMISALEKKCHVSVAHPKKLLMWLVWLVLVVHFINLLTILYRINHYYLNQVVTSHYNCSVWRRKLEIFETWQKRRERGRSEWTQGYSSLPEFHLQSCNDWGQLTWLGREWCGSVRAWWLQNVPVLGHHQNGNEVQLSQGEELCLLSFLHVPGKQEFSFLFLFLHNKISKPRQHYKKLPLYRYKVLV